MQPARSLAQVVLAARSRLPFCVWVLVRAVGTRQLTSIYSDMAEGYSSHPWEVGQDIL